MKHIFLVLLFINFALVAAAQNLVPNYSFELADSCPTNYNTRFYKYSLGCVGWGQATTGTADYFNACDTAAASIGSPFPIVGIPNNALGHQAAYHGIAYAGFGIY